MPAPQETQMGYLNEIEIALLTRYLAAQRFDLIAILLAAAWH